MKTFLVRGISLALGGALFLGPAHADPGKARTLVAQGIRQASSNADAALASFNQAADEDSSLAAAHYNQGVILERRGRYAEAEAAYKKAVADKPDHYASIENLANLALRQKQTDKAEKILLDGIRSYPADLGLRNRLIAVWLAGDKVKEAEDEAKKILKADERNVGALVNLATVFFRRKQLELATSVLTRARDIDPNEAKVWINLGFVYLAGDDKTAAAEAFKKATELRSDLPEALNNLGALNNEARDYEGAIVALNQALALYPTFGKAYLNLGNALKGAKRYAEAEQAYKKSLELDPDNPDTLFNLGILHIDNELPGVDRLGRFDVAKEFLTRYTQSRGPTPAEVEQAKVYIADAEKTKTTEERRIRAEERRKQRQAAQPKPAEGAAKPEEKPAEPGAQKPAEPTPAEPGGKK
ncbi:MAG: tetratricopeptide repeat protein [Deltaproteobacteria bacterium]|nr:tetratricopeptide repeat protein [Deltaproteobacteria bacterium]